MAKKKNVPVLQELERTQEAQTKIGQYLQTVFLVLLAVLLIYPPYYRGMFFDQEFQYTHIFTAVILIVFVLSRRGKTLQFPNNLMDWAGVGVVLAYLLSISVAINVREGIGQFLRYVNYLLVYLFVAYGVRDVRDLNRLLSAIFVSGLGIALWGLGAAYGVLQYNGAFDQGMINSRLQYHNATAIFLAAVFILGLYLTVRVQNIWLKAPLAAANYLIFMTVFGAQSRGTLMVWLPVLIMLFSAAPRGYRSQFFINLVLLFIAFGFTSAHVLRFDLPIFEGNQFTWLILGMVIAGFGQYAVRPAARLNIWGHRKVIVTTAVIAVLLFAAALVIAPARILPRQIYERFENLDLKQYSTTERFTFWRDSVHIIADRPILGAGGGGWNATYRKYQSYQYNSTEVHNQFLQTWIETGTVGFLCYLALWVGFVLTVYRLKRTIRDPDSQALVWAVGMTAAVVGLHSAIDFSLSLGSVAILLWAMFGSLRAVERTAVSLRTGVHKPGRGINALAVKIPAIVGALALIAVSAAFAIAYSFEQQAQEALDASNIQSGLLALQQAAKFDPFQANYPLMMSQIHSGLARQNRDPVELQKAVEYGEKAAALNGGDPQVYWNNIDNYLTAGRYDEAVRNAEKLAELVPMRQESYDSLAQIYAIAGRAYYSNGQQDKGRRLLEKVPTIPVTINRIVTGLTAEEKRQWIQGPMLSVTPIIRKSIEDASAILNNKAS